jgi:hypothetical protein
VLFKFQSGYIKISANGMVVILADVSTAYLEITEGLSKMEFSKQHSADLPSQHFNKLINSNQKVMKRF